METSAKTTPRETRSKPQRPEHEARATNVTVKKS